MHGTRRVHLAAPNVPKMDTGLLKRVHPQASGFGRSRTIPTAKLLLLPMPQHKDMHGQHILTQPRHRAVFLHVPHLLDVRQVQKVKCHRYCLRLPRHQVNCRRRAPELQLSRASLPDCQFFICLKINRYLAKDATAHWLHRVAEGGPVTYVFLGHAHATSFLAYFNRDLVSLVQLPRRLTTLPTPLPHMEAEATSAHRTPTDHEIHQEDAPQQQCKPVSALILKDEWLEMILSGRKT